MSGIEPYALERWMYRRDGLDYGPFSVQEIYDLIREHRIDGQTEIRNVREKRFVKLEEVPRFKAFLDDFLRKEAEEKRRREVLREAERFEKTVRRHSRLPFYLGLPAIAVIGVGLYLGLQRVGGRSEATEMTVFRHLEVGSLPELPKKAEPQAKVVPQKGEEKKKARRAPKVVQAQTQSDEALTIPQVSVQIDLSEESTGRTLTEQDVKKVQNSVSSRLKACFDEEARTREDFQGGEVVLYIMPSGSVALSAIKTSPPPSSALVSCASAAAKSVAVPPFSGSAMVMRIPFFVADLP